MQKTLYRNEHDKMIAGVASGLAEYMGIEVTIVRLLFVLAAVFMAGGGLIAYLVLWAVTPTKKHIETFNTFFNQPDSNPFSNPPGFGTPNWTQPVNEGTQKTPFETQPDFKSFNKSNDSSRSIAGMILLVLGCILMMRELEIIPFWFTFRNFFKVLWPIALIAIGLVVISKSKRKNEWADWQKQQNAQPEQKATDSASEVVNNAPEAENNSSNQDPQV
ncbi:PspC domain-containing protein [Pedobacter sp. MW01-1-1]|uniref:PspC domain-containing protein n=1 Tax=Pedobacter sp. MW01-1-1 TaxID=3383027 RepID=UPI003FEE8021